MTAQPFDEFGSAPLESNDPLKNPFKLDGFEADLETPPSLPPASGGDDDRSSSDRQFTELQAREPFDFPQPPRTESTDFLTGTEAEKPTVTYDSPDPLASPLNFDSGTFLVGDSGRVSVDYIFDGGYYQGELAIFSLTGMEAFAPDSPDLIREAARRSLSDSTLGHIVISDRREGAKIDGRLPGEPQNWNRGQYNGEKTVEMTPGDRFGVMLVPNGTVAEVYEKPKLGGSRRPLFSMATANPDDAFHVGQVADVTGDGRTFVIEDQRADGDSDRDYNDVMFRFRGATGTATSIDDLIDPALDWRDSDLGRVILDGDDLPDLPQVSATFEDTGLSDRDGITSKIAVSGNISQIDRLSRLQVEIEGFDPVEITDWVETDGSFEIDRDRFNELLGGAPLEDRDYTLVFQTEDLDGNLSDPSQLSLTLDLTSPTAIFGLSPDSDTPPPGDDATELATVTLAGQTEAGSRIVLSGTTREVFADDTGYFEFTDIELELGDNTFAIEVTDPAGNRGQQSQTLVRLTPDDPDTEPPVIVGQLAEDTGTLPGITSNPAVIGTVTDESQISQFVVRLDGQTQPVDATAYLDADGNFSLDRAALETLFGPLPDGVRQLHFQALDDRGNLSETFSLSFTLDTDAPALVFGLDPDSDTPPQGDNITEADVVALIGTTEAGATVTFGGTTVVADANGQFTFHDVSLNLGENVLDMQVTDGAGNSRSVVQTIVRENATLPDTTPPVVSAALTEDTGTSASDGLTSNPAVSGRITDSSAIAGFVAGFATDRLVDIRDALSADGQFVLDRTRLDAIFGNAIPDGNHTLYLQAADEYGNLSDIFPLDFTLDTTSPGLSFGLDPAFDTLPVDDGQTAFETVTLAGSTDPGARVELLETGRVTVADNDGHFVLTDVTLTLGENQLTVVSTDAAGNSSTLEQTVTRLDPLPVDEDPPVISAQLANDTGRSGRDANTSDPTIVGAIVDISQIDYLLADLDGRGEAIDISDLLQDDGSFAISPDKLVELNGEPLTDGRHTVSLQAADEYGNLSGVFELTFVLDTTAPPLTLDFGDRVDSNGETDAGTVTVTGQTEAHARVQLLGTGTTVTADATGQFEFSDVTLEVGENALTFGVTDIAGNTTEQQQTVTRVAVPDILLEERDGDVGLFNNLWEGEFVVPETPSVLSLELTDLNFDVSDEMSMADALEVAIVDEAGQTLVRTIASGRDTLFNLTEGQAAVSAAGAEFDGRVLRVDLSEIEPGTAATLQVRLVNNDNDLETSVRFRPFEIRGGEIVETDPVTPTPPSRSEEPVPDGEWVDVSSSVEFEYRRVSFNRDSGILFADLALENLGSYWFDAPLRVGVRNISDPTVRLRGTDGVTDEGVPYYDFSDLVSEGALSPGGTSEAGTLEFYNPNGVQFDGELVVWSQLNRDPLITGDPETEVLLGKSYTASVVAEDPDGDVLSYELVEGPPGLSLDSETGELTWAEEALVEGNHTLRVRVEDGRGGVVEGSYILEAIEPPPNRPPIFTSTPVVEAYIQQPYVYDADAIDPDGDVLDYGVSYGPDGLTVDSETGVVNWTPSSSFILGDTVLGQIGVPGEQDSFTFNGTAGQRVYFDPRQYTGSASDWSFTLFDPDGKELLVTDLYSQRDDRLLTLLKNGEYRVVVDTNTDRTGSYGFSVLSLDLASFVPFDTPIEGVLETGTQDAIYRFTGNAEQKLFIDNTTNSGNFKWVLYGPDNVAVESQFSGNDMELYLPEDGEYVLVLQGKGNLNDRIEYAFEIVTPDEIEQPLQLGINANSHSVTGEIGEKGEEDIYTFEAEKGQRILFDRLFSTNSKIEATIFSPSDQNLKKSQFNRVEDYVPITFDETGTYRIVVDASGENTGSYRFSVLDANAAPSIAFDTLQSGRIDPGEETHLYQFNGEAEQRLFVDLPSSLSGENWKLYDSGNQKISSENWPSEDPEYVLPRKDTYTLAVVGKTSTPWDYEFEIVTPNLYEKTLALNTPVYGNLTEKGDRDVYTLTGYKGQILFLDALEGTSSHEITLTSPSGQTAYSSEDLIIRKYYSDYKDDRDRLLVRLPEDGVYELLVDGDLEQTGRYGFQLIDVSTAPKIESQTSLDGILDPGFSVQFYQFEGGTDETVYFDSLESVTSYSSYWYLYNSNLERIASRQLKNNFEIDLHGSGTYYLGILGGEETPLNYSIERVATVPETASIALDTPANGEIAQKGERDIYTFTGAIGQHIAFELLEGNSNLNYEIFSPSNRSFGSESVDDSERLPLTESGQYRVEIDGQDDTTGTYRFQIATVEDDFTPSPPVPAIPLALNTPRSISLAAGETKRYRFTGQIGQKIWFDGLTESDRGSNVYVTLYDPSGTEVFKNYNLYSDELLRTLTRDGNYDLVIESKRSSATEVSFQLLDNFGAASVSFDSEVSGNLSNQLATQLYRFTGEKGQHLYLERLEGDYYNYVHLYAPDGRGIDYQRLSYDLGDFELPGNGEYILALQGNTRSNTQQYGFEIVTPPQLPIEPFEFGSLVSGEIAEPGQANVYTFEAESGQRLWFDGLESTNSYDPRGSLYDPQGARIWSGQSLGSDRQLFEVPTTGTYRLEIDASSDQTGEYRFRILDVDAEGDAHPIALDSTFDSTSKVGVDTDPAATHIYGFDGTAGQVIYVDRLRGDDVYSIYDAAGQAVATSDTSSDIEEFEAVLPKDGRYSLVVEGRGTTTDYEVRLGTPDFVESSYEFGQTIVGSISEVGERDTYTFEGAPGQLLYLDNLAYSLSIKATVTSPSDRHVQTLLLSGNDPNPVLLNEAGTYTLEIDGYREQQGDYSLRLLDLMAAPTVALDTEITGDFGESRRAADAYRLTGEADRTLFFDRLTGDSSNYYRLYDSAGQSLFWRHPSLSADSETTLPRDGEYVLVFDGRNGTDNSYRLEIVTPEFPTFDLTLGETVTNELTEPGEQHTYTFTGKLGQTLFYQPLFSSSTLNVSLLDEGGKKLWEQQKYSGRKLFTLSEEGTYQLIVDGEKDAVTGYGFQLFDLASSPELPLDIELSGDFGTSEREAILYQFESDARTHLYFEATGESTDRYALYAPDGTEVFFQRFDLDIEQELTDEGTYTLALLGWGGTRNDYALTVRAATFDSLSLPFGQVVEGTLEGAGDRHIYEFTGRIGQSLFFDGLSADPSLTATLLAPGGSALSSVDPDKDWSKPLTLTESGLYRLEIDGENTATGDYSFRLSDLSATSPLPLSESVSGTVLDSEVELYQIEGTAGQVLNFDWLSADSEAYWNLYDPGNRALTEFKKQSASLDFEAALPLDGRYTLAVASSGSGANEYSFEVTDISTEPIATSGLGTKIAGNLPSGETRTHRFTASAGMQVYFDSLVNNYIRTTLIAPDGTETFSISSSNDLYTINPVTLTQTGEYVVKVSPWSGEYGLQLLEFSQDASERIQIGQAVSGTTDGRAARVYNFDGQIGQRILLNGMTGQNVDAKLYTPNGEQVFSHDFYYSRDTNPYALELDGVYHLVISGENDSANDYQFQLLDLSAGREVKLRMPVEGSLPTGQYGDVYKINGRADQRLYFDLLQGTSSLYWELYDPNYQSLERQRFNTDLEDVVLPEDGEYTLYLEGGTSASPLNYRFQVWADDDRPDIVTPGDGRTASGGDGALFEFPVALEVADGNGGTAAQEYTIRLMPDPLNTAPEIISTPLTDFGLNQRFYEYQLKTFDAEDDDLNYRLIDGPSGAVVTQDTGMLGWFPQDARAGETYGFKVEVSDGRGGRDVQEFEVTVQSATGAIRGAVFDDLNGNGYRDSNFVVGESPNILFVVDTSPSMGSRSVNWGDPNTTLENFGDRPVSVQDLEWASIVALAEQMSAQDRGDDVKVGFMAFGSNALTDMDVETPGFQPFTNVAADRNGNNLADYREAIQNPLSGGASAVGTSEMTVAAGLADSLPDDETLNVIFMSDGFIGIDEEAVTSLREKPNVNLSAFAIGTTASLDTMQRIDPNASRITRPDDLLDIFGGWTLYSSNEPLLENVTVYLDLDNDGQLDETEPQQKTQPNTTLSLVGDRDPYYFNFEGLLPGTYHVRQVVPNGRHETAPPTGSFVDTVTVTGGETFSHLFGLQDVGDPPNAAPEFQTTAPEDRLTAGEQWRYSALALDPDADAIAYDLPLAPEGAFVDVETGLVVWKPQAEQTGTFDFLLRVQDDRGARSIQAFQLTVEAPNQAPVFVTDDAAVPSPQVGKPFEFEFRAIDPEGDAIAYSLADSSSNRVTLDETGRLTWTPSSSELGQHQLTLVARDDRGAETQQVFPLTVIEAQPNQPPQIAESPAPNTRAQVGVPYTYALPVRDPDGDTLTYRAIAPSPTGLEIDDTGRAIWIPTAEQFGRHDIAIEVEDAQGATELVTWTVDVTHQTGNSAPVVTSEPTLVATIEQPYRYRLEAIDPDGDALIWQLDDAPTGAVLDPLTGVLSWQPTETQLGDREFAVRVTDSRGSFSGQGFTVQVNGTNTPPAITSVPSTAAGVGQPYRYVVEATDPEGDALRFSLGERPEGMTVDELTGEVLWDAPTLGTHTVEIIASDSQNDLNRQRYTLVVEPTAVNQAPRITSTPQGLTGVGTEYTYTLEAEDPDGDSLTYALNTPVDGATLDPVTGRLSWTATASGRTEFDLQATDPAGAIARQRFAVVAFDDRPPVIQSNDMPTLAVPETLYRYDIRAYDPNGTPLTYRLDDESHAKGMTLDDAGRLRWTPGLEDLGQHPIEIEIVDGSGATTTQAFTLTVAADTAAPEVELLPLSPIFVTADDTYQANLGDEVRWQVAATDDVGVTGLQLFVNGEPLALDANGTAVMTASEASTLEGWATDAAGNVATATVALSVFDPSDTNPPVVSLDPTVWETPITHFTDVLGTAHDPDGTLDYYSLEVAPATGGEFVEFLRVEDTDVDANSTLGEFDPTTLLNDSYRLRLTAADTAGNLSSVEEIVDVAGELKLGNFQLSFTDMEIPVSGIPISVTRTYDSLTSNWSDELGYGWRLEFRDTDLRTSLPKPTPEQELLGQLPGFKDGDRVYVTVPGGKRVGFTFEPRLDPQIESLLSQGAYIPKTLQFRTPEFVADDGSHMTLSVSQHSLVWNDRLNAYTSVSGVPYNPASSMFGGTYTLTTKDGIEYKIDGTTGDLVAATDLNGNELTFTDDGIFSDTGVAVTFARDAKGRITEITDPDGEVVSYEYDAAGDLVAVTDREEMTTTFGYGVDERPHYLDEIIDPLGRPAVRTEYDEKGRLKRTLDVEGDSISFSYDPDNATQIVKDANDNPTFYEYDDRGNVIQQVNALGHITQLKYEDPNNPTRVTSITDPNGNLTTYRYDENGNLLRRSEPHPPGTEPSYTHYGYDENGNQTSITLPTGATFKQKYDARGNLLRMEDAEGNLIQAFTYDRRGNVTSETDPFGTTIYGLINSFGNALWIKDPNGDVTTSTNTKQGWLKTFTDSSGTSEIFYDKSGRELKADYGDGLIVEYDYEGAGSDWTSLEAPTIGRIERRFTEDGKLGGWLTPGEGEITFTYNENGQLKTETDPSGRVTTYTYDPIGRVKTVTDEATGLKTEYHYDRLPEGIADPDPDVPDHLLGRRSGQTVHLDADTRYTTATTYYPDGKVKSSTDARGNTTFFDYTPTTTTITDALERQTVSISSDQYLPLETRYADGTTERQTYLFGNNLLEAKDYPTSLTDRNQRDRLFDYDELGRLETATDWGNTLYQFRYEDNGYAVESPTGETLLSYEYNDDGDLKAVTYLDGGTRELTYSETDNRLEKAVLPSGFEVDYDYTASGLERRRTVSFNDEVIEEVVSDWNEATGQLQSLTDATGTTTYHYDAETQALSGVDYPNGGEIRYDYDVLGRVEAVTVKADADAEAYETRYRYDGVGNLTAVTDPTQGTTAYEYDEVNRLTSRTLPNGVKTVYTYKENTDFVESMTHLAVDGTTVLSSVSYDRSASGEPTKITREDGSYRQIEYDASLRVEKESFYDATGTLLDEVVYTYDADGNRQTVSGGEAQGTYRYENVHQLTEIDTSQGIETYTYDEGGRVETISRDGETLRFEYDENDQLTKVSDVNGNPVVEYTYDSEGRRVEVTDAQGKRDVVVAPTRGRLESPFLIVRNAQVEAAFAYAGDMPLARVDEAGNPVYYLTDAMGSVIGLVDGNGQEVAEFRYDSFGNLQTPEVLSEGLGGDFRFQGQWLESNTDLYHFRARYYDPETGRFVSRDPVEVIETVPESSNPYQFVYNNPLVYSDPTGEFTITEVNTSFEIQGVLNKIQAYTANQIKDYLIDKARGVVGELAISAFSSLLPQQFGYIYSSFSEFSGRAGARQAGNRFEAAIQGAICGIIGETNFYPDSLWLEPAVGKADGKPNGNGYNCKNIENGRRRGSTRINSFPDFIFKSAPPTQEPPKAWLIGDFKYSLKSVRDSAKSQTNQWKAITRHAQYQNQHQYAPIVTYFTLQNGGRRGLLYAKELEIEAVEAGVALFVFSVK